MTEPPAPVGNWVRQSHDRLMDMFPELAHPQRATAEELARQAELHRERYRQSQRQAKAARDRLNRHRLRERWRAAEVPPRHRRRRRGQSGPWSARLEELAGLLACEGALLALLGTRGTGKTQMAADLIRRAVIARRTARYRTAMEVFLAIRATYDQGGSGEKRLIDDLARVDLLVLDELHERGQSAWEDRLLTHLIDRRYRERRDTLLIANQRPEVFAESVGPSITDRLKETGGVKLCDWPSFRNAKRSER